MLIPPAFLACCVPFPGAFLERIDDTCLRAYLRPGILFLIDCYDHLQRVTPCAHSTPNSQATFEVIEGLSSNHVDVNDGSVSIPARAANGEPEQPHLDELKLQNGALSRMNRAVLALAGLRDHHGSYRRATDRCGAPLPTQNRGRPGSELAIDAFVVAAADVHGGALIATFDIDDLHLLAGHAHGVRIASIRP
jgi:hypothetical protein